MVRVSINFDQGTLADLLLVNRSDNKGRINNYYGMGTVIELTVGHGKIFPEGVFRLLQ